MLRQLHSSAAYVSPHPRRERPIGRAQRLERPRTRVGEYGQSARVRPRDGPRHGVSPRQRPVAQAADDKIDGIHEIAVERVEAALIEEALKKSNGNISQASKWLGLSRLTLREKGKKFGILSDR